LASTYQIFERAERIELVAAAIYQALAERFAADPEARAFLQRLQAEELQHASRVRLLAARYRHDPRLLDRLVPGVRELESLEAECEAVLAAARAGQWGRDLEDVYRLLGALEDRFARAHADLIAREGNAELRAFFVQLAAQDQAHARIAGGRAAGAAPEPDADLDPRDGGRER